MKRKRLLSEQKENDQEYIVKNETQLLSEQKITISDIEVKVDNTTNLINKSWDDYEWYPE
jgi:hypothetical protein